MTVHGADHAKFYLQIYNAMTACISSNISLFFQAIFEQLEMTNINLMQHNSQVQK
jgi:hypothetical protein